MNRSLSKDWRSMKLSKNFTLGEFVISASFPEIAKRIIPLPYQVTNFYDLSQSVMQPVRDEFGRTVPTSGLRDRALSDALGGVRYGQHFYGEAVDFICPQVSDLLIVYIYIKETLQFKGELIYYPEKGHIHIAKRTPFNHPDQFISRDK